jgi:multidrug resistance efflux pump
MKKVLIRVIILAIVAAGGWYGYTAWKSMPQRQVQIATTKVRKGEVVVRTFARGEVRAVRSATLMAPNLFGTVQVTQLASLGSLAKEKDLIVEFDDAEVQSRVEEKQLELDQIDEQIKKAQADLAIRNNQDQVELLRARYAVRRAELEVRRNELLPQIDQRKNDLNLEEARRRLKQLESDIQSRREQAAAEMAVLTERKRKGNLEMARERQRLLQVKLLSPMSGLVAIRQNRQGSYFPGMQIPDVREGDQVSPGMPIADVLDLSELEVVAKIGELDRANLKEGQDVLMRLDAVGDKVFHGKIKSMSGTASANIFSGDPAKKFDVVFSVDMAELLSGLGAKQDQIKKILAQAEINRRKGPMTSVAADAGPMMAAGGGGGGRSGGSGGGMAMAAAAGEPAMAAGGSGGGRGNRGALLGGPGGPGGAASSLSAEDQQKVRAAMQKALNGKSMGDLSNEERQKVMAEVAKAVPAAAAMLGGAGRGGRNGAEGGEGGGRRNGGPATGIGGFSERELDAAKLPPPIDPENQLEVLLRPGLLADVEIILEKVSDAINIPAQAVFERDGKQIVFVKQGNRWEERTIKPIRRSESIMIIAGGVQPGETIAMADPTARPGDKKKKSDKSGSAVGSLPGGGRS